MEPTEAEISAALAHYRERIVSHNREAFTKFVHIAETAQPNAPKTPEGLAAARLRFIRDLFGISRPELHQDPIERIDTPADVELKWPRLVRAFALDGVTIGQDDQKRESDRAAYREGILNGIRSRHDGDSDVDTTHLEFPNDFWTLMGMVSSLEGHGWPQYREHGQQIRFWDGLGGSAAEMEQSVVDPETLDLEGWEVLAGWECGQGPETTCYVLYCRAEEDEDGNDDDTSWGWRYVADMGQYGDEVFDNVVELLEWYEELHVPDLDHLDWYTNKVFSD
ncbi:hypothetical protein F5Y04DRAFT_265844 [Hypomontagnella monticulosa]|nr:hypothetical protein F5Y04DRAFT_265844 [Hypomontagnella monticulosa]